MCGFAALLEAGHTFAPMLLRSVDRDLFHRGPDSGGVVSEVGAALVFRRLAILDPQPGSDQPMTDPSGRWTLVFNGEIYNFEALRSELEAQGVHFRTRGDTEVLLQALIHWDEAALARLEGMFAFVLLDRTERRVRAGRDPFGIKPLYIARRGGFVGFASETRPLRRIVGSQADSSAVPELLLFGFAAGRVSNFQHIERVPGGCVVEVRLADGSIQERRYCDPLDSLEPEAMSTEDADARALEAVRRSIHQHLRSDVGYTVQLSGGVDSSLVSALAAIETDRPITTFGVYLGDTPYDERAYRDQVVARYALEHHEIALGPAEFAEAFPRAVERMEGPTAHFGCVMLMLLCEHIRAVSKVVLTGEGADEMFGGYMRYGLWQELTRKACFGRLVPGWAWPRLSRYREIERYAGRDPSIYASVQHDFLGMMSLFPELVFSGGARDATVSRYRDARSRLFAVDQSCYLASLLNRQDKMAMAASVEARVPFTHLPLARVLNRIPHALRAPGDRLTKPILKRIAEPFLPHDLLYRRKIGLNLPVVDWAADEHGLGRYLPCLTEPDARLGEFTPLARLREVVDAFRRGQRQGLPSIPQLLNVELWLRSVA